MFRNIKQILIFDYDNKKINETYNPVQLILSLKLKPSINVFDYHIFISKFLYKNELYD